MRLLQVTDKQTQKLFHQVPYLIYKNDRNWPCPLHGMVEDVFSPAKNPSFKTGEAVRWVLVGERDQLLGRIAAF